MGGVLIVWEEIGNRISTLRRERKLTQAQFGELLGISRQYVGRIEAGQRLSVDLISVICKKIGVSADYIIFGSVDTLDDMVSLIELSPEQISIGFDILKKLADFINTDGGNEALIRGVLAQQRIMANELNV